MWMWTSCTTSSSNHETKRRWRYHRSAVPGYFEYFQFREDIGAKPLPVLATGVFRQHSTTPRSVCAVGIPWRPKDDGAASAYGTIEKRKNSRGRVSSRLLE